MRKFVLAGASGIVLALAGACSDDATGTPDNPSSTTDAGTGGDVVEAGAGPVDSSDGSFDAKADAPKPVDAALDAPPVMPAPPTADQVKAVRADWGNLKDAQGRPIVTPYVLSLLENGDAGSVNDWLTRLKAEGDTHIVVQLTAPRYPGYPIAGVDFASKLPAFKGHLVTLIERGFIPIVMLGAEGETGGSAGTYGHDWFVSNVASVIAPLRAGVDLAPYCLWVPGWRLIGPSGPDGAPDWDLVAGANDNWWAADQFGAVNTLRAAVGDNGQIGMEFGEDYINIGGVGDWYSDGLIQVDVFLENLRGPFVAPGGHPPDDNQVGAQQCASRTLGPSATNIGPGNGGAYYFAAARPRGPISVVAFETTAYWFLHGTMDAAGVTQWNDYLYSLGFRHFGNGQPTGH
jgi:hypothetical protein